MDVITLSSVAVEDALLSCAAATNAVVRGLALHAYVSRVYRPFLAGSISRVEGGQPEEGGMAWKLRNSVAGEGQPLVGILVWASHLEAVEGVLKKVAASTEVAKLRRGGEATLLHVVLSGMCSGGCGCAPNPSSEGQAYK